MWKTEAMVEEEEDEGISVNGALLKVGLVVVVVVVRYVRYVVVVVVVVSGGGGG